MLEGWPRFLEQQAVTANLIDVGRVHNFTNKPMIFLWYTKLLMKKRDFALPAGQQVWFMWIWSTVKVYVPSC